MRDWGFGGQVVGDRLVRPGLYRRAAREGGRRAAPRPSPRSPGGVCAYPVIGSSGRTGVGMQAGRVLSQARWANPRRKPVKRRSSARIAEAALCGVPARPSGAVSPQKERTSRDREAKGREGVDLRSRSEGAGAPPPAGLTCVRPWRRRLARRRPLACCCHQLPMDPQLPAIRSRLFSPLHENNEKSVQVSAAMVCPKCKISLPPPYLDDSPVEFSIPLISLCCSLRGVYWILDARWEKLGKEGWNKGASCISESSGGKNNKIGLLPKKPGQWLAYLQLAMIVLACTGYWMLGNSLFSDSSCK